MTREQITAIYEDAMDKQPPAGKAVMDADDNIQTALDDYCSAIRYETFLWAYEMGFDAGRASTGERKPAHLGAKIEEMIERIGETLPRLEARSVRLVDSYVTILLGFEMEERERCSGLR